MPALFLLKGRNSAFSPRSGDSFYHFYRFMSNLAWPSGTSVRLAMRNCLNRCTVWVHRAPKYQKKFTFWYRFALQGRIPWPISTVIRWFNVYYYLAQVFYIWHDSLYRLQSYCRKTALRSFTPNFLVQPVGKIMPWIENDFYLLEWARCHIPPCKVWGDRNKPRRL